MSARAAVWLTDVLLIGFGQQWSSMAQRGKRLWALDAHIIHISNIK